MVDDDYKRQLSATYDLGAIRRDALITEEWKIELADLFMSLLPPRPKVVDVGAGTGQLSQYLSEAGADVTAIDISERHVEMCRSKGIAATVVDITTEGLGPGCHDGAWAMNSLLHVARTELDHTLTNIAQSLVTEGLFLWCQWGGNDFEGVFADDRYDPPRFFSLFDDADFEAIDVPGMDIIERWTKPEIESPAGHHPQVALLRRTAPSRPT